MHVKDVQIWNMKIISLMHNGIILNALDASFYLYHTYEVQTEVPVMAV